MSPSSCKGDQPSSWGKPGVPCCSSKAVLAYWHGVCLLCLTFLTKMSDPFGAHLCKRGEIRDLASLFCMWIHSYSCTVCWRAYFSIFLASLSKIRCLHLLGFCSGFILCLLLWMSRNYWLSRSMTWLLACGGFGWALWSYWNSVFYV